MVMMPTSYQEGRNKGRGAWRGWQWRSWLWKLWWGWGWANDDDDDDEENNENNEDANLSSGGSHSGKSSLTEMTMRIMIMRLIMVIMLWWCWRWCQPFIRRVALREEQLDWVLGKRERDNGRCARPHDDALCPQPDHDYHDEIIMVMMMISMNNCNSSSGGKTWLERWWKWRLWKWLQCSVHGLTMMHSAHNLMIIMIFYYQDDTAHHV